MFRPLTIFFSYIISRNGFLNQNVKKPKNFDKCISFYLLFQKRERDSIMFRRYVWTVGSRG